jgi:hypothetical protein
LFFHRPEMRTLAVDISRTNSALCSACVVRKWESQEFSKYYPLCSIEERHNIL